MLRPKTALCAAALLAAALTATAAQAGPPGSTVMLTRPAGFGPLTPPVVNDSFFDRFGVAERAALGFYADPGRRLSGGPSGSNRYNVFVSRADGMSDEDNNGVDNVFVRDLVNNTTTLVSRAGDGTPANADSGDPAISADGQFVVFASSATNLVPNVDTNGTEQIYERDLVNGTTKLISRADGAAGVVANGDSFEPSVSGDGKAVAFTSTASNLPGASDHNQVYVRSNTSTQVVSVINATSTPGNNAAYGPSLSDDGSVVAFTSDSNNLTASDTNGSPDVFIHRLQTGATLLASVRTISPSPGAYGNDGSAGASISSDGSRVAFSSAATNFNTLDASGDTDVYLHDFNTNTTGLASQGGGAKGNADSYDASISANGAKIAFTTASTNLSNLDTNGVADVYVNDTGFLGGTSLASRCQGSALLSQGVSEGAIAPSGSAVSFSTESRGCAAQADDDFNQVYMRALGLVIGGTEPTAWISRPTGTGDFKSGTNDSSAHGNARGGPTQASLSQDGSVSVFTSESDELSPDDNNAFTNVFVRENKTGVTELISRASGAGGAGADGPSGPPLHQRGAPVEPPSISADGRYVAFTSAADNLVFGDANDHEDVFVRDRATNTTTLVSVKSDGTQVNADSFGGDISADGSKIAFASAGVLDPAHDTAGKLSVYVHDMATGTTTLVSRQSDPGGLDANGDAVDPSISGDGTHVAFLTDADNLIPSPLDGNGRPDVYVRDLAANQTRLGSTRDGMVSASDNGAAAGDLDFTGTHLAFESASDNMAGADSNGASDVFVRDLGTTTTTLVSRGPGGAAGNKSSGDPSISADGTRIAFDTSATDLTSDANPRREVLVRDLTAGTLTLVSRADGADGAPADDISASPSISADGHCVAFDSFADNLVAGPPGTDFEHGFMRALDGDCGTPPPPPGPPGTTPDTTAPVITGLRVSPSKLHLRSKKGVKIRFTLSEAASVSLKIERKGKGRKKGSRCVAKRRTGKKCTLYKAKLTLKRSAKAGANSVAFNGRIGKRKLAKGSYRITATAVDAAGNKAKKKTVTFKVVK